MSFYKFSLIILEMFESDEFPKYSRYLTLDEINSILYTWKYGLCQMCRNSKDGKKYLKKDCRKIPDIKPKGKYCCDITTRLD